MSSQCLCRRRCVSISVIAWLVGLLPVTSAGSELFPTTAPTGRTRRWGAAMPVGPSSSVNLETGRVLTELPVVGWSGRGPAVSLSLYHNMTSSWCEVGQTICMKGDANGDGGVSEADIAPFVAILLSSNQSQTDIEAADFDGSGEANGLDLPGFVTALLDPPASGPVWTHTYSTSLDLDQNGITVIWGDGTKDRYVCDPLGVYTAPAGVFSTLATDPVPGDGFHLTTKAQFRLHFLSDGRLDSVADPSDNRLIMWDSY